MIDLLPNFNEVSTFVEKYISIHYVLSVLFCTEIVKIYWPYLFKGKEKYLDSRLTTILVSAVMLVVFFEIESPENVSHYKRIIFISFLFTVATYDFLLKPLEKYARNKIKSWLNKDDIL